MEATSPFFNPYDPILKTEANLPHWDQGARYYFATFRLADSLPVAFVHEWMRERDGWQKRHPPPWDEETEREYWERFDGRIQAKLDQGMGACLLGKRENASIVHDVLRQEEGCLYDLEAWAIMPNHVHVLFHLREGSLSGLLQQWKGVSAHRINQAEGRRGTLWQKESWDRIVRSPAHLIRVRRYVLGNPGAAGGHGIAWGKE